MALKKSPLAPERFPDLPPIAGLELAGRHCGLKHSGAKDLMLAVLTPGASVAGVFTRSRCSSAPVDWCKAILPRGTARAIVCNSGNANAFTGKAGDTTVQHTAQAAADLLQCSADDIYLASTGVIGVPVEADYIGARLPDLAKHLSDASWRDAAEAIMTTDTFPKGAGAEAAIDGMTVKIAGFAKGSGMIAPDMATMLGFIFTNANIPAPLLQRILARSNERSFNAITVDGDTSTSDTVLLCATGAAGNAAPTDLRALKDFERALDAVMIDLAQQIVRDGEGATKFITVNVTGAVSARAARRIGLTIANSPLVKTAIAGEDANWGRIVMAVGKAGERADRDLLSIAIGGVTITKHGQLVSGYDEAPVAAHMKGDEIVVDVDIGIGRRDATVWTCDLTHDYISINGDYRS
ncbi:MAG: bifunctional glutamate N-acetyltransferase/amino-acid acetyltransferase ArgJ [Rhodospirillaceae bacterium]|nr:bifunctional glutamate N-acetyltransferase/amino-acid acetyltransferase ArgJ [Rhodospirillaceae bacterium]